MAFIQTEDLYGTMEVIAFEDCYKLSSKDLIENNIVYIEGRTSIREDEDRVTIIANKIINLEEILPSLKSNDLNNFKEKIEEKTNKYIPNIQNNQNNQSNKIKKESITINVTNLDEKSKEKLRGCLRFFMGDGSNTILYIINGETKTRTAGIYANDEIAKVFEQIAGKENVKYE